MIALNSRRLVLRSMSAMRGLHRGAFPTRISGISPATVLLKGHLCTTASPLPPQHQRQEIDLQKALIQWPGVYRVPLSHVIMSCSDDAAMLAEAKEAFIEPRVWKEFVPQFRRAAVKDPVDAFGGVQNLRAVIEACGDVQELSADDDLEQLRKVVIPLMLNYAVKTHPNEIAAFKALCNTSDLRLPHEWFPYARLMKRKIYYHGGPTNSGKTYRALQRLKQAQPEYGGGLYCGPLRLLALEVYEQLNASGVYCDLVTGQEKRNMPFSTHVSCTVEMINFNKDYDVAVVDEIQMIGNEQRGHCWTRALQGLRAREIHLCGGIEAAEVVESLCKDMGDDYEFVEYKRLSPLHVADESLQGDYSKVEPGDCIVAFSRADIFSIKREIEATTKHKCCVVYGQLPSETRSQQAKLFNTEGSGYDVLVASDAIGMGLNLNIRRVIFHTTLKLDKGRPAYVEPAFVKQIAGRAGRASSKHKEGIATAWQDVDLAYIRAVMEEETPQVKQAGLFPIVEQVEYFAQQLAQMSTDQITRLSTLLGKFVELAQVDGRYTISEHTDLVAISNFLQPVPLTLAQRFTFANAPVNTRDSFMMQRLYQFATCVSLDKAVSMNLRLPSRPPTNVADLSALCAKHNELDLYLWLALRYPRNFVEKDICQAQKRHAIALIDAALHSPKLRQPTSHINAYRHLRTTFSDQHGSNFHPNLLYAKKMREFLGDNIGLTYPAEEPSDDMEESLRRSNRRFDRSRGSNGRRDYNGERNERRENYHRRNPNRGRGEQGFSKNRVQQIQEATAIVG